MDATLDLMATQAVWVCSNCHAKFDAFWRPVERGKQASYFPPATYQWTSDKPTFNYCPECGACFRKEFSCDEETCELRI